MVAEPAGDGLRNRATSQGAYATSSPARSMPTRQCMQQQLPVSSMGQTHVKLQMANTCCGLDLQVHAVNERILSFGDAIRRMVPEAADINQTSVTEVSQVCCNQGYFLLSAAWIASTGARSQVVMLQHRLDACCVLLVDSSHGDQVPNDHSFTLAKTVSVYLAACLLP